MEEALIRKKSEVESERLKLEQRRRQLQDTARTMLSTMQSPTADLLQSPNRDLDEWRQAKNRLSEKIQSVNQAITSHGAHGSSSLSPLPLWSSCSPSTVSAAGRKDLDINGTPGDRKKQALMALKRKAAREALQRNNQVWKEQLTSPVVTPCSIIQKEKSNFNNPPTV